MSQDSFHPHQSASHNTATTIQIGGDNSSPITITQRPKLTAPRVPNVDRQAAMEPVWANTPTPNEAVHKLASYGIAVIKGDHGTGRRISAIRSLDKQLARTSETANLYYLAADWDENEESPPREILPEPTNGYGYILDAATRPLTTQACQTLTSWAEELHRSGSGLIIIGNYNDWRGDKRYEVSAISPNPNKVARNHLTERLSAPDQARWIHPDPDRSSSRWSLSSPSNDRTTGIFSDLLKPNVSPSDSVIIAERIQKIDPQRVDSAIQLGTKNDHESKELGAQKLREIREEILLWENFLESILTEKETPGEDRVMLLAAAYLENAPLELCIKAASEFAPHEDPVSRRFREGRSPRRRMLDVGVDITSDDRATFDRRPGLAISALRMDWLHWNNERQETKRWLENITACDGVAAEWTRQVGERLLDLSRTEPDPPFFSVVEKWLSEVGNGNTDRLNTIAHLITRAANSDELARDTHKKLLEWANQKTNSTKRSVVALVCSGQYGRRWPRTALTRLRHILALDDPASEIAAKALIDYATTTEGLRSLINTVDEWLQKFRDHPAGSRAFLALVNYFQAQNILGNLLSWAQADPGYRDFLITGWCVTLEQQEVHEKAHQVLVSWAHAVHQEELDRETVFGIIADVRNAHTPVDAMSRFLYGSPDEEDPAVVDARFSLANLRACNHSPCGHPECPQEQQYKEIKNSEATDYSRLNDSTN